MTTSGRLMQFHGSLNRLKGFQNRINSIAILSSWLHRASTDTSHASCIHLQVPICWLYYLVLNQIIASRWMHMNLASRQVSLKLDGMWGSWWMIIVFWIPYCLPVQWTLKLCTCGHYTGFAVYHRLFDKSQGNEYICYLIHTLYHITTPSCQCGHVRGSSVSVRHFWGTVASSV